MLNTAYETEHDTFVKSDVVPPTIEQHADIRALNPDELDDVSGGLIGLLVGAAYVGLVGYSIYKYATR